MRRCVSSRSFDNGRDRWEVSDAAPAAELTGIVDGYSCWVETTLSFTTRRELAATSGVFIINLGSVLEIVDARGVLHRVQAGQGFVGGISDVTSLSRSTGDMAGVQVKMPLLNMARLFPCPMSELANRVVMLDDLAGADARALGARLVDGQTQDERWSVLDRFVFDRLAKVDTGVDEAGRVLGWLAKGRSVQTIADDLGWSRKRVAQHSLAATGLLPRTYARLVRFERFAVLLQTEPAISLAEAAVAAGYADQPHLTRDVGRFAALTPRALRARILPEGGGVRD